MGSFRPQRDTRVVAAREEKGGKEGVIHRRAELNSHQWRYGGGDVIELARRPREQRAHCVCLCVYARARVCVCVWL